MIQASGSGSKLAQLEPSFSSVSTAARLPSSIAKEAVQDSARVSPRASEILDEAEGSGSKVGRSQIERSRTPGGSRPKRFICTVRDCGKAYTRPTRLEEHVRSHTGERPFQCLDCPAKFLRDSHLKAHSRKHLNEADKSIICPIDGCQLKFWTNSHLKKHVQVVHEHEPAKTYGCPYCREKVSFRKHHQLRTHVAEVHSTPGGEVNYAFKCDVCEKSFKQKVHLTAHTQTHDPNRYMCTHPSCLSNNSLDSPRPRSFATWSALQKHTKTAHPPHCPFPDCLGKTFTTRRGLKLHLSGKVHRPATATVLNGGKVAGEHEDEEGSGSLINTSSKRGRTINGVDHDCNLEGRSNGRVEEDGHKDSDHESDTEAEIRRDHELESDQEGLHDNCQPRKKVKLDAESLWACPAPRCNRRFKSAVSLREHATAKHSRDENDEAESRKRRSTALLEFITG